MLMLCERCEHEVSRRHTNQKYCVNCAKEVKRAKDREYAAANREQAAEKSRLWHAANKGRASSRKRDERANNPDVHKERDLERYQRDGEAIRARARSYYANNRDKVLARMSTDAGRAYSREAMRVKMRDPAFRLHSNISGQIRDSLVDKRGRGWEALLGYSTDVLHNHLERQFLPKMSWGNYGKGEGKWHVDHIVPRDAFNLTSEVDDEFRACWALTNLRPLWGVDNIAKGNKRLHLL